MDHTADLALRVLATAEEWDKWPVISVLEVALPCTGHVLTVQHSTLELTTIGGAELELIGLASDNGIAIRGLHLKGLLLSLKVVGTVVERGKDIGGVAYLVVAPVVAILVELRSLDILAL